MKKLVFSIEAEGVNRLATQLNNTEIALTGVGKQIRESKKDLDDYNKATREQQQALDQQGKGIDSITNRLKGLRVEQLKLRNERREDTKALKDLNRAFEDQRDSIPSDSLVGLRQRYAALRKEIDLLSRSERESEFGQDIIGRADRLKREILEIGQSVSDGRENVGNYREAFVKAFSDITGASNGLAGVFDNVLGFLGGGGALSGISSGAGEVLGVLGPAGTLTAGLISGAALIGDTIISTTLEYEKLFALVSQTTGTTGTELRELTAGIKATSETFDQDFNEILEVTNTLSKGFGIGFDESLEIINTGLTANLARQDEFLDKIREYPVQFANAGFSAEDFLRIATQEVRGGIFDDKLTDSIKEADVSLREFTKAQEDALQSVLGEEATRDLSRRIREGETTTKDAILEIGKSYEEAGADIQDYATLTADVFKGAGEDVGGFQVIYENVNAALSLSQDELVDKQLAGVAAIEQLRKANEDLAEQQSILAAQFAGVGTSFEGLTERAKAFGLTLLNDVILNIRAVGNSFSEGGFFEGSKSLLDLFVSADFGLRESVENLRKTDDEALASKQAAEQAKEDLVKAEEERLAREARAKQKAAEETRKLNGAIEKENRARLAAEKKAQKEIEKIEAQKVKDQEAANKNIIKLQEEVSNSNAKVLDKTLADAEELQRQVDLLLNNKNNLISALVGTPEQIEQQTSLINRRFDIQVQELLKKSEEAAKKLRESDFTDALSELGLVESQGQLDALNEFNSSDKKIEDEKKLQEALLQLRIERFEAEKELVEGDTTLDAETRTERLLELAQREKDINEEKNKEIIEQDKARVEAQKQFAEEFRNNQVNAIEGAGQAFGDFFQNLAEGQADAGRLLAQSLSDILLDLIEQQLTLLIVSSFAQPDSVASFGASGALRVAALTGLVTAAVSGLRGLIGNLLAEDGLLLETGGYVNTRTGGIAKGRLHSQGGIKGLNRATGQRIEFEGNEAIIKGTSTQKYAGLLSAINVSGGGARFAPYPKEYDQLLESLNNHRFDEGGSLGFRTPQLIAPRQTFSLGANVIDPDSMAVLAKMVSNEMRQAVSGSVNRIPSKIAEGFNDKNRLAERRNRARKDSLL